MTAQDYLDRMSDAIGTKLIDNHPLYGDEEGHRRLAREMGSALADFSSEEQKEILTTSYSSIYVRGCFLRPILNAKEWINEMQKDKKRTEEYNDLRNTI